MNEKKHYIWKLACFLYEYNMKMSGEELADHLNRNNFLTSYGSEYEGKRGTYTLIQATWKWVTHDLNLPNEAKKIAESYIKPDGTFAYE
jgi:hypothetical protein